MKNLAVEVKFEGNIAGEHRLRNDSNSCDTVVCHTMTPRVIIGHPSRSDIRRSIEPGASGCSSILRSRSRGSGRYIVVGWKIDEKLIGMRDTRRLNRRLSYLWCSSDGLLFGGTGRGRWLIHGISNVAVDPFRFPVTGRSSGPWLNN